MSVASIESFNNPGNLWPSTMMTSNQSNMNVNKQVSNDRQCANCEVQESPTWRNGPNGIKLCNRCGLYWLKNKSHYPLDSTKINKSKKFAKKRVTFILDHILIPSGGKTISDFDSDTSAESTIMDVAEILLFDLGKGRDSAKTTSTPTKSEFDNEVVKNSSDDERKCCSHCSTEETPLWRKGPNGDRLCNRCGVYWRRHNNLRPLDVTTKPIAKKKPKEDAAKISLSALTKSAYLVEGRANSPGVPDAELLRHAESGAPIPFFAFSYQSQ